MPSAGEGIAPHQESLTNSDRFHLRGRHRVPGLTAAFHRFFFFFYPSFFFTLTLLLLIMAMCSTAGVYCSALVSGTAPNDLDE